ncbi:MAG: hypothetical protein Q9162_006390 [Coniocarpon cinnabarinum]
MANFMEELWNSIFTPGPTPTLLIATNVTFGALLFLLLCLLIVTWSIHFLILSILSASLWAAINWFAREVNLAHAREEYLLAKDSNTAKVKPDATSDQSVDEMDSGDDTEIEAGDQQRDRESTPQVATPTVKAITGTSGSWTSFEVSQSGAEDRSNTTSRQFSGSDGEARRRAHQSMAESTGSLSTDSEWEKVDEER